MSGFITSSGENYLLELFAGVHGAYPTYFFALGRQMPPTRHTTGSEFDEPISGNYSRAAYINASGNWTERVSQVANVQQVVFPVATTAWGQIKYWALCSSSSGGDLLWAGAFPVPLTVGAGDQVVINPGAFVLKATGYVTRVML